VWLPILLNFLATLSAAIMAYASDPAWVRHRWGLGLIMFARRLQWPLATVSLILCVVLLGVVISGKRRVWWLIGLAPVLMLFGHRFLTSPASRMVILDEPAMVSAADAKHLADADYVVGVMFNGEAFAYPYSTLFVAPVIVQSDRERRMLLMWSAYANAATALEVSRDVKARELDIVSNPADSLLVYNSRNGQFMVALTGLTPGGEVPTGVERPLAVKKLTWKQWRAEHPETRVMLPVSRRSGPRGPVMTRMAPGTSVALIGSIAPLAVRSDELGASPINATAGDVPVVVFRDKGTGEVRAFDRRIEKDLIPRFNPAPARVEKGKTAAFVDSDTGSGWSVMGVAVEGDKEWRGKKLEPVAVQEDVYLGPARFWCRDLKLYAP
jgi:hypothetical protein